MFNNMLVISSKWAHLVAAVSYCFYNQTHQTYSQTFLTEMLYYVCRKRADVEFVILYSPFKPSGHSCLLSTF